MRRIIIFLALAAAALLLWLFANTEAAGGRDGSEAVAAWTPRVRVRLPIIISNHPAPSPTPQRVQPADFQYLGAFRLPDDGERPRTFAYGGNAMTYDPAGNAGGPNDGFPGSLFITGHDRMPYGELSDGSQVAEVSIPAPLIRTSVNDLPLATFVQGFRNVAAGFFTTYDEIPRVGMQYLNTAATGARIHLAWGQHFQEDDADRVATHAWFSPLLSAPNMRGSWYIGDQSPYSVNGYLLEIPAAWADLHVQGRYLGTGRYKDGGWSGMGPALFAYRPWVDGAGAPAPNGAHLPETTLLLYEKSTNTESIERALTGYQHADEWEGGAWITTAAGKTGLLFGGNKGVGAKYWYGFINPAGAGLPCPYGEFIGQFTVCRLANGAPCPAEDLVECAGHTSERGWWSARFTAQLILYDVADLARVAAGQMQPWQPQPYAVLDIEDRLFHHPTGVETELLGSGVQRRYKIGDVTFDRAGGLLYVLELFADDVKPVVHVWRVQ